MADRKAQVGMKILDRYVARTFLIVLVGSIVAFLAIFIVVDLTQNVEKFIEHDAPIKAPILYYLHYAPFIVVLTLPVGMLLASLTTLGGLVRSNELLAMKASGISVYLPIRSLTALALFVVGFSFLVNETVVPASREAMNMVWNRYVSELGQVSQTETINRTLDLGEGKILFVRSYNSEAKLGQNITFVETSDIFLTRQIQARQMHYLEDQKSWQFEFVTERIWVDGREQFFDHRSLIIEDLPDLSPQELATHREDPEEMGYSELLDFVRRGLARGRSIPRALVELHMKISFPFANLIIVLFGAALAAVRRRTGLAVGFTASILICFIYYIVMETGRAFGYNGDLSPVVAAWLGNFIFGGLSIYFLYRARF